MNYTRLFTGVYGRARINGLMAGSAN